MSADRKSVLDAAAQAVLADRNNTHGAPENTFGMTADLWSTYLGIEVSAHDVAVLNLLQKVSRIQHNSQHTDSWVDIAGYAACGSELACIPPAKGEAP